MSGGSDSKKPDTNLDRAAQLLNEAEFSIALTGAGVSVESGIPPFRGPGGLWTKYGEPPLDGYERFISDPKRAWEELLKPTEDWLVGLRQTLGRAKPNVAHFSLAKLESLGAIGALITQNVDDLHRQAGQRELYEIHGNFKLLRCVGCSERFSFENFPIDVKSLPPKCPNCKELIKDDTVHFGEPIPSEILASCERVSERADCILVVGTSATVYPAAGFAVEIARRGGTLIEINPEPTELTELATIFLGGTASAILNDLSEKILRLHRSG